MRIIISLLLLCVCMPNLIHYGNAIGFIPILPYGGVVSYGHGSGGAGGALLLLFALPLLFGFGGFGKKDTVIVTEDAHTRFANILIKRSRLTGQDLTTFSANIRMCTKANKDQTGCTNLGNVCHYVQSVGICIVN
ncbi:hypothetical protein CHS0354_019334 [Potamilus streckersoni]|uniref:Uncharacterized protein n=1 Tax=Potamilus streckersoni TaxID=2493646 RepID=A0AAE0VVD2_9BIVA|nr:hypothetical protein CHS0354_019334 [Potamilus streckersoni]